MPSSHQISPPGAVGGQRFATTHWSVVLAASQRETEGSATAMATLCETYWYPLYCYVRRQGCQASDAQDLVQQFFTRVLEKDYLAVADRERGRFRSFLLTVLKRFLSNEQKHAATQKRGGGEMVFSLDFGAGEERFRLEPTDDWTPEKIYERRWALTLLDHVLEQLGVTYRERGKEELFQHLKIFLTATSTAPPYRAIAEELEMTESAVKVSVHRLRERYRNKLREEIANTVASDDEVDDELNHLLAAIRGEGM